jgi:hypothetical protein
MRIVRCTSLAFALVWIAHAALVAQVPAPAGSASPAVSASTSVAELSLADRERFLAKAKIVRTRDAGKGVTGTLRATLSDGVLTHDASIQTIDEFKQRFESPRGTEFNFVDTWRYNVAAYRLDRLLDLGMTPPSVERRYNGKSGSFTWWVDDVLMDEGARYKQGIAAPDAQRWNEQMWHVRLFDQLIYNVDRNLGNLVIDKDWAIWMIDHTRAFRLIDVLKAPGNIARVDRRVLDRLKALDRATLRETMKHYLTSGEIKAVLDRRDAIVAHIEQKDAVFDWNRPPRPRH